MTKSSDTSKDQKTTKSSPSQSSHNSKKPIGYLPHESPSWSGLLSLGFQHVLAMFPATTLVAILTGFDVGVTLFASGLATVIALYGSGMRIPMYYGGSFAYIAAIIAVVSAQGGSTELAQVGIIATAFISMIAGIVIRFVGKEALDKVLPPIVTGPVAIVIGIALAQAALDMAISNWTIALVTLMATILFSVYLKGKGILSMIPLLLGALVGYVLAVSQGLVDFTPVAQAAWFAVPSFSFPDFSHPDVWNVIFAIAPIAVATIPESTAHLYQLSLYIDKLAEKKKVEKPTIKNLIGLNLILDGIGDFVNGMIGGVPGTNYGENNSLMAITKNYSAKVMIAAGVIAMIIAFIGKFTAAIGTLPVAVTGGLAIYLFGVIGLQGVALMMSEKVDLFDARQLAIGAVILVVGIGGSALEGSNIPMFGLEMPAIATAAVFGIVLNLIFLLFPAPEEPEQA